MMVAPRAFWMLWVARLLKEHMKSPGRFNLEPPEPRVFSSEYPAIDIQHRANRRHRKWVRYCEKQHAKAVEPWGKVELMR